MIVDSIDNASKYYPIDSELQAVFEKLQECLLMPGPDRDYSIGSRSTVSVQRELPLRDRACPYEYHKQNMDIHLCLAGTEIIEYSVKETAALDASGERDFYLAEGECAGEVALTEGMFALFFTGEMHKPQLGDAGANTSKCMVKIRQIPEDTR